MAKRSFLIALCAGVLLLQSCGSSSQDATITVTSDVETTTSTVPVPPASTVPEPKICSKFRDRDKLPLIFCDRGTLVFRVQAALSQIDTSMTLSSFDGIYGGFLRMHVSEFQKNNGLPSSGQVDAATWKLLIGSDFESIKSKTWLATASRTERCAEAKVLDSQAFVAGRIEKNLYLEGALMAQIADIMDTFNWADVYFVKNSVTSFDRTDAREIIERFLKIACS